MITIKNEFITAQFNEVGAELKSLFCNDREYMWPGHPEVWTGTSPIMFPICSGLKEDKYILNGKEYTLQKQDCSAMITLINLCDRQTEFLCAAAHQAFRLESVNFFV